MATNVLLGIGGTGAKIVESVLFLLAAGVGPAEGVTVGLIDQDNSNGNVNRTETLLHLIGDVRRKLDRSANAVDWGHAEQPTPFFAIPVKPLFEDERVAHWRPAADSKTSLVQVLQHDRMSSAERDLCDLLFRAVDAEPAHKEQDLELDEGYRGRAHVGAAALLSALHNDAPAFLTRLTELLGQSSSGSDVRVMIVGSLFGGTGAAGFPSLARSLHQLRTAGSGAGAGAGKSNVRREAVRIGGVLMLPYFGFRDPNDQQANVISTAQLLPQAQVAVEYYDRLLREEGVFDRLYLSGWDSITHLNYHERGRQEQCNPALLPEMISALGVLDFFTTDDWSKTGQPLLAARHDVGALGWSDLPGNRQIKDTLFQRMAQVLRFAVIWRNMVEPALKDRSPASFLRREERINTPWVQALTEGTQWQGETAELRDGLWDFTDRLLTWAATIGLYAHRPDAGMSFQLWNADSLLARRDPDNPRDPLALHPERSEPQTNSDVAAIVLPEDAKQQLAGSDAIYHELSQKPRRGNSAGLGRVIAAVHHAVRPFHGRS